MNQYNSALYIRLQCAQIWQAGAILVYGAGVVIKAKNDWSALSRKGNANIANG